MAKTKKLSAPYDDYEVSSDGTIYSTKGSSKSKVATRKDDDGYERVNLSNSAEKNGFKTFRVHELVAKAFLGSRPDGAEILHKDGNCTNNSSSNLEYGSKSKNATQREARKKNDSIDVDDLIVDSGELVLRIDSGEKIELGKWSLTPEGYLKATAVVARVGPLIYKTPTGEQTEYVTEEALKNDASSLIGKPVTFEHPPGGEVNADNYTKFSKGEVSNAYYDEDLKAQVAEVLIKDRKTIDAVTKMGIVEVSPGYRASIIQDRRSDAPYKFKQVKRYNNHLAITRAGRGGPESAIRLDSKGHAIIPREDSMKDETKEKLDALEKEKADMEKKMDAMKAKIDAYEKMAEKNDEKDEKEEDKTDSKEFVRLYNERNQALELAQLSGVKVDSTWTNAQLKSAIVRKHLGEEVRCDSAEALQGAFDAVAKMAPKKNSANHLENTFRRNDAAGADAGDDLFGFYDKQRQSGKRADSNFFAKETE